MYLKKIEIKNFRNIENQCVSFCENTNVIIGKNGEGKTNFLEAIFLLSGNKSFRAASDKDFFKFGEQSFFIGAVFENDKESFSQKIGCIKNGDKIEKKIVKNEKQYKTRRALLGNVPMTVFSPDDLELIKSGPSVRRNYLDLLICTLFPVYARDLSRYNKIVMQKNALLKNGGDSELLNVYNRQMSLLGASLSLSRYRLVSRLLPFCKNYFSDMADKKDSINISYISSVFGNLEKSETELSEEFFSKLCQNESKEKAAQVSLYGPHRDELEILINSKEAKLYASQGQQRSAVLSLLLSKTELIKSETGKSPIVILDDVMSELDSERQKYILEKISDFQVFISCCQEDIFTLSKNKKIYTVSGGKIKEE